GDFGNVLPGEAEDNNAVRSLTGIRSFSLSGGDYYGLLSTGGQLQKFKVKDGDMRGRIRALDDIRSITLDSMINAMIFSGSDVLKTTIRGDMENSRLFAGFDPADDLEDGADANMDDGLIDALTDATSVPADVVRGGTIKSIKIVGDMRQSWVSAAVGPGEDAYIGNDDDVIGGTGFILKADVRGEIFGSAAGSGESYGFVAASTIGPVKVGGQPLGAETGNFVNRERIDPIGPPHVSGVKVLETGIEVTFDQPLDISTIRTNWFGDGATTFTLLVSENGVFGDADDVNVSEDIWHSFSYNDEIRTLTLRLVAEETTTWEGLDEVLNAGTNFLLTIDGSVVADPSGELLDGEYENVFPTGDGVAGGDFVYRFHFGDYGDTADTALDITDDADATMFIHNQITALEGEIGDNRSLTGAHRPKDVDVFRLDAVQGDILYVMLDYEGFTAQVWTYDGVIYVEEWEDSLTGLGYYTEEDTTYFVTVAGVFVEDPSYAPGSVVGDGTGSYQLSLHLFNDGNGNFNAADTIGTDPTWIGWDAIDSLASNSTGDTFAVDNDTSDLISIDTSTGVGTDVGAAGYVIQGLDYNSSDELWGIGSVGAVAPSSQIWFLGIANDVDLTAEEGMTDLYLALNDTPSWQQTSVNVRLLTNLQGIQILDQIDWLASNVAAGDLVFFYYSGPGDVATGDIDGDEDAGGAVTSEDETIGDSSVLGDWLTDDEVADALEAINTSADLVAIFDSSYAGGMVGGLEDLDSMTSVYVMMSSAEDEDSSYVPDVGGEFTIALVEGIVDTYPADANTDDIITLDEWFTYALANTTAGQTPENYDSGGLGAVEVIDLDPATPSGMDLVTINTTTGAASLEFAADLGNASAIAFDGSDTIYAVNADANRLVTIAIGGAVTDIGSFTLPAYFGLPLTDTVVGLDFVDGTLYGMTSTTLYEIDPLTAAATLAADNVGFSNASALSYDPTQTDVIFGIDSPAGPDRLISIKLGFAEVPDASQTPTTLPFVGDIAQPEVINADGEVVQILTAPDDVDVYGLGTLAEGTPIEVTLLTRTIGSDLQVRAGVFNSSGNLIASLYFPPPRSQDEGGTYPLDSYLDNPVISAYAPADDEYFVAIWGTESAFGEGSEYRLTVEKGTPVVPVPVSPAQTVYLNFTGGVAEYLVDYHGIAVETYISALDAEVFGFNAPDDTQTMIDQIVVKVEDMYSDYGNIS
ncbi:MAG: caspase family protein, partial [Phycisphaerae bacterium]|nr:caspase family protein [Phycisphaerae bacterium]